MRASSPPANNADILDSQMPKRNRPFRRVRTTEQITQEVVTHAFISLPAPIRPSSVRFFVYLDFYDYESRSELNLYHLEL